MRADGVPAPTPSTNLRITHQRESAFCPADARRSFALRSLDSPSVPASSQGVVWEWAAAAGHVCVLEVCLEVTNLLGEPRRLTVVMQQDAGGSAPPDTRRLSLDSSACSVGSQVCAPPNA